MTAYYNEIDPYAAEWLRNLIKAGHIAPGVVDERSIEDVSPSDLSGFTQCHFFAGIGVWSYALRQAGWPDDRPVWTGSCPCQPFSAAGKGAGFDDERHLWPSFQWLIDQCRPAVVFGEQVASSAVDAWIDLVQADVEALGYAFGSTPFPSAGVGAPHIRDRNYWMAHAASQRRAGVNALLRPENSRGRHSANVPEVAGRGEACGLADSNSWQRDGLAVIRGAERDRSDTGRSQGSGEPESRGETSGLGNADNARLEGRRLSAERARELFVGQTGVAGFWRDADWIYCRDGKWRPVEPGTFPLAHGATSRVGRLRAYGNAINAEAARVFIECAAEAIEVYDLT